MTSAISAMRRYLALTLPWLPAERAMRANAAPRDAFALIARAGVDRIVAVSADAAALGIVGLTLADARARVPGLVVVPHAPDADAALLDWLADGCERYSPTVACLSPDTVLIDITGCRAEFAGEGDLAADAVARFARHGVTAAWAIAATPDAAAALARFGASKVTDLPVAALGLDDDRHLALRRAGLTTVGMLAARPQAPLAARFGAEVPRRVARLTGREDVRLVPRRAPPAIAVETRLVDPVVDSPSVMRLLDRLIADATERLTRAGQGGKAFDLALFRCDGHVARLRIATDRPTRDAKVIALLFGERIDALADPLDPGFGYDLVRLAVPHVVTLAETQLAFDDRANDDAALGTLLDRLTTRLGPERVRRLAVGDSHIPERASLDVPFTAAGPAAWSVPDPAEPPRRPLHLFTPPQPIEVLAEVPDGPPRSFRWRRVRHDVRLAEGPERIAAEWWRRRDGRGTTRDYYRLEDSDGRRFWVFRHGLFGTEAAHPKWFLHGLFA